VPLHAGIGQVSRLTGDLAPTLVPAPVGKLYRTPPAAEATLTDMSTPTVGVAATGTNRAQRDRSRNKLNSHSFMVHPDLSAA
jgi:hypothetical protein